MMSTGAEQNRLPHILVILATTRRGRFGDKVAGWLFPIVQQRADLTAELVDLRDWQLPYYPGTRSRCSSLPACSMTRGSSKTAVSMAPARPGCSTTWPGGRLR
jgi:hypothetical protein